MRRTVLLWLTLLIVLLGIGAAAAWQLRQPLQQGLVAVGQKIRPAPTVRFAVVGDNHGDNPIYRQILDAIRDEELDFLLNLADTSEDGTAEEFAAVVNLEKTLPFPVYHIVGNHDIKTNPSRQAFREAFGHPAWGSQDIGPLHLIRLDNADRKIGFTDDQLTWLATDLAEHPDSVIVIAYHRPFGLPLEAVFGDDETRASRQTNERLLTIFAEHDIAYVFSGHLHTYLTYSLQGIPAAVSGGGGGPGASGLGRTGWEFFSLSSRQRR